MIKKNVADAAASYVQYDMIHKYTELPKYAEPRLQLVLSALQTSEVSRERSELFQLVTALVQLGMDTHDMVDTESGQRTENQMRSRQLKILAGDYFSARFYQLLAKAGEVELIGVLSKAVADVNRLKVSFYEKVQAATLTAEEYIKSRIHLKNEMFYPFSRYFEEPLAGKWNELLQTVTGFEVIYEELKDHYDAGGYARSLAYWILFNLISTAEEKNLLKQGNYDQLLDKYNIHQLLIEKLQLAYDSTFKLLEHEQLAALRLELETLLHDMSLKLAKYSMKRVEAQ